MGIFVNKHGVLLTEVNLAAVMSVRGTRHGHDLRFGLWKDLSERVAIAWAIDVTDAPNSHYHDQDVPKLVVSQTTFELYTLSPFVFCSHSISVFERLLKLIRILLVHRPRICKHLLH